ncbi:MAG TPA: hypothetical protein VEU72_01480 [Nitrosopumilaceae archaeon]|nr:hypothetical protein [Nitrosopumilaceae archaeon]
MTLDVTSINKKHLTAYILAVFVLSYTLAPAFADQQVSTSGMIPVNVQGSVSASDCTNSPGPYITLNGVVALTQIGAQFTFQNNDKGTHMYTSTVTTTVINQGDTIQIPKQPVLGGVGGNPYIWIQFEDNNGNPLSSPVFLGRCVQGLSDISQTVSVPATLMADVSALECSNTNSDIDLTGNLVMSGLNAKIIFTNNDKGTHTNDQFVKATVIPSGISITFPKQPSLGGVGGNPFISLQFQDANGATIGNSISLGRCVQNL